MKVRPPSFPEPQHPMAFLYSSGKEERRRLPPLALLLPFMSYLKWVCHKPFLS